MENRELKFSDAPVFNRVMRNSTICKELLERVLKIDVGHIHYLNTEHTIDEAIDAKGVRLDLFAKSENKIFDVEMQMTNPPALGRRMRYYQAQMDMQTLEHGQRYGVLPASYIVFICRKDPFDKKLPFYSFNMVCNECKDVDAGNDMKWIALNASAYEDEKDEEIAYLLEYINTGHKIKDRQDKLIDMIDSEVSKANSDKDWREQAMGFMTLEHDFAVREEYAIKRGLEKGLREGRELGLEQGLEKGLEQGLEQGLKQGLEQGQDKLATLGKALIIDGRSKDLEQAFSDPSFRDKLYKEYGL